MDKPLYDMTQCALYKVQSKTRLAALLHVSVPALRGMSQSRKYRQFTLEEEICPFTGKKTKVRDVQTPAEALRPIHERIHDLLRRCTPPAYAHAAIKKRSYRTNAEAHKTGRVVATFDLKSFYPSTSESAVFRFFADQMLCAHDIAGLLARLVCVERKGSFPCLPTGSPLSPLISIYANKPMFDGLAQLAEEHTLTFTCYVDDLTFSGRTIPSGLEDMVTSLARRYGHKLSAHKTKKFGIDAAKHITGVVILNGRVTVPNSRFHKARKIQMAINAEPDRQKKIALMEKLAGLIGEAAYLDSRYRSLMERTRQALSNFRMNTPVMTVSLIPETLEAARSAGFDLADSSPF